MQFGYLGLFSCVFPLTAVLLLINNLTEIRSDAYKMCKLFRKPFAPPVANMGVWQVSRTTRYKARTPDRKKETHLSEHLIVFALQIAFEVLSFVSVMSNCWLLLLSPQLQKMFHEFKMSPANVLVLTVLVEVRTGNKGSIRSNHTRVVSSLFYPLRLFAACADLGQADFAGADPRRTGLDPKKEGAHRVHVHAGLEAAGWLWNIYISAL